MGETLLYRTHLHAIHLELDRAAVDDAAERLLERLLLSLVVGFERIEIERRRRAGTGGARDARGERVVDRLLRERQEKHGDVKRAPRDVERGDPRFAQHAEHLPRGRRRRGRDRGGLLERERDEPRAVFREMERDVRRRPDAHRGGRVEPEPTPARRRGDRVEPARVERRAHVVVDGDVPRGD
eukprot:16531-Pelagococcus_subviridis.AAC.1